MEPATYQLNWAANVGGALTGFAADLYQAGHSVQAYLHALERLQIPYDVLDPAHARDLSAYAVLVMPWPLVVNPDFGARVLAWVRGGGTLLVEAECDAYDDAGIYRYANERPFAGALGLRGAGRRPPDGRGLRYALAGADGELPVATWVEPQDGDGAEVLAADERGATVVRRSVGDGVVVSVGSYPGAAHWASPSVDFERFVDTVIKEGGGHPPLHCDIRDGSRVQWRFGYAGEDSALLFVINMADEVTVTFTLHRPFHTAVDLTTGGRLPVGDQLRLRLAPGRYHIVKLGGNG